MAPLGVKQMYDYALCAYGYAAHDCGYALHDCPEIHLSIRSQYVAIHLSSLPVPITLPKFYKTFS